MSPLDSARGKRALVSGYYGFGNAGDEAILAGMIEGFRELAPEVELTVLSGSPAATEAEHGVKALPRGTRTAGAAMRGMDLFISGGGGLIQDATSWGSPLYYLWLIRMARRRGLPVACIGHSIGPLRRGWIRALTRWTLEGVEVLAVRDHRSREILRELGLRREVEVTGDLAFLLPGIGNREPGIGPRAGIAVRRIPGEDRGRGREIGVAAVGACREAGLRPVLAPMQHPEDLELAEEVARATLVSDVVRERLTAREVLALFAGFDLVVAMRLHALIFAAIAGVPLVGISYDPKVEGLTGELGLSAATSAEAFDGEALTRAVREAWERREEMAEELRARREGLRAAARRNVAVAVGLVR
jgi:polysaccharide pyruvyl transferase CsaB